MKIAIVGSGYVGLVSGACFADFGHQVTCIDNDPSKISRLQDGEMLHNTKSRHPGEACLQFSERLAITFEELVQKRPEALVGECSEDRFH